MTDYLDNPKLLCQDIDGGLAKWFANRLDARVMLRRWSNLTLLGIGVHHVS
jgi:hypothetical protein